jgi:hypothetical protein
MTVAVTRRLASSAWAGVCLTPFARASRGAGPVSPHAAGAASRPRDGTGPGSPLRGRECGQDKSGRRDGDNFFAGLPRLSTRWTQSRACLSPLWSEPPLRFMSLPVNRKLIIITASLHEPSDQIIRQYPRRATLSHFIAWICVVDHLAEERSSPGL